MIKASHSPSMPCRIAARWFRRPAAGRPPPSCRTPGRSRCRRAWSAPGWRRRGRRAARCRCARRWPSRRAGTAARRPAHRTRAAPAAGSPRLAGCGACRSGRLPGRSAVSQPRRLARRSRISAPHRPRPASTVSVSAPGAGGAGGGRGLGPAEPRCGRGLDNAADLDERIPGGRVRVGRRLGHAEHRRHAGVGAREDLRPLVPAAGGEGGREPAPAAPASRTGRAGPAGPASASPRPSSSAA